MTKKEEMPIFKETSESSQHQREIPLLERSIKPQKTLKSIPKKIPRFPSLIKEYLESKDIELLESLIEKQKEYSSKIRINDKFGKQSFY